MSTPKTIIAEALDDFKVNDFIDPDFNANAADKIIADLEDAGFNIVGARAPAQGLPTLRAEIRDRVCHFHRNACYPDAMRAEIDQCVDGIMSALSSTDSNTPRR